MDIKDLNHKEVCFSLDDGQMKKSDLFKKQRLERGWDDTETYALDVTFGQFMLPRMKRLYELKKEVVLMSEGQKEAFEDMISALEIIASDEITIQNSPQVQRALFLFGAYFYKLGW